MASTSQNLLEAQVCPTQFGNELSFINHQQALISEETPEWQNQCYISPFRLSLNNQVFNPYPSSIAQEPSQSVCKYHNKNYEYVCCNCRQMQCKLCQCLTCVQQFDVFKAHRAQGDTLWSRSLTGQHRIISLNKFLNLVRKQNKNTIDPKLHQYKIIEQKQKLNKTKTEVENKIASVQIQTQVCIEMLRRNTDKCQEILRNQMRDLEWSTRKKIQAQTLLIEYCQIMNKIITFDQDSDAIDIIIKNWHKISHQVNLGDVSKSMWVDQSNSPNLQNFRRSIELKKNQKSDSYDYANKILQNLRKIKSQWQKLETMNKSEWCLAKSLKSIQKISNHTKKGIKPTDKIRSSLALNEVRDNCQKERLGGSITNLINKQIIKINKSESKNIKNQIQKIFIYGGVHKSSIIQYYYPWRTSKSKLIESVRNKQERNEAPSHTGFGLVKLKEKMSSLNSNGTEFLIIGGYYNSEMSDCIFRVNCQKRKKELAGRISQPLAYFGFTTKTLQREGQRNTFLVYMCGGLNYFREPVSSFTSMQFSQTSQLINENELPALEQPRYSLSITEHRSYFYAIGGINNQNKVLKTVNKYCPQTQSWIHFTDLTYERCRHSSISLRSGLYIIGGWNGQNYLRSVERLQQSRSVFNVVMDMKQARCSFGLIGCPENNAIIILGGKNVSCLSSCQYLSIKNKSSCSLQPLKSSKSEFFCF